MPDLPLNSNPVAIGLLVEYATLALEHKKRRLELRSELQSKEIRMPDISRELKKLESE